MTIGEDIVKWAKTRPLWQQRILQSLAEGREVTETELAEIVDELIKPTMADPAPQPLELAMPSSDDSQVCLTGVVDAKGVNALVDGEELRFSPTGLTVIYGDNGSGKSGYARLVKDMVGARHPAEILADVFEDVPEQPSARLLFTVDGEEEEQKFPGVPNATIRKIAFHDEHCGDAYLEHKSVVTYRPSALVLLDGLIDVCDRLRSAISSRLVANNQRKLNLNVPPETPAGAFLAGLTPTTTEAAISAATKLADSAATDRAEAAAEEARLETSDANRERTRLSERAAVATRVAKHLKSLATELNGDALVTAAEEVRKASTLREAAKAAASADFTTELEGVGGETWRALWQAARRYSVAEAYKGEDFPVTHDAAKCVLCQQTLDQPAADRLRRFDHYMTDTTERDATAAEGVVAARLSRVRAVLPTTAASAGDLSALQAIDPELAVSATATVALCELTKSAVLSWLDGQGDQPTPLDVNSVLERLLTRASIEAAAAAAVDVEAFRASLVKAQSQRRSIEAAFVISEAQPAIKDEVRRLAEQAALNRVLGEVSTTPITAKSTQLTKEYAGDVIKNEFIRETERLRLRRVTIQDLGGKKGQLEQQPSLLGAKASKVRAVQVLSEGEQTAMGLAGFFTEAAFDPSKSALVLDDPVTSLDHVRRGYVAERLVELAQDRQVIVFTHETVFVGDLQKASENAGVALTPRSVERRKEVPGYVKAQLPWKAKDFKARLHLIDTELARLTKERANYGQDEWDKAVGTWAGDLSELWESCVSTEILDQVFDRGTAETRPLKFRILAQVTIDDDKDLQAGYGACSKWARRHNKAPETNYVPPEPEEMRAEVDRIKAWQGRLAKYRS